jgi:hypothetical protein
VVDAGRVHNKLVIKDGNNYKHYVLLSALHTIIAAPWSNVEEQREKG